MKISVTVEQSNFPDVVVHMKLGPHKVHYGFEAESKDPKDLLTEIYDQNVLEYLLGNLINEII